MKIIATFSPKGGSGKTTITANLASYAVTMGKKVCLYDNDPQLSITEYFNNVSEKYKPQQIESNLNTAPKQGTDFVFVDCEPSIKGFIPSKDFLIIAPTLSSRLDLHSYRFILELESKGYDVIRVINKYSMTRNNDKATLEALSPCCVISQNSAIEFAMSNQKTIWNSNHPNGKRARNQFSYLFERMMIGSAETLNHEDITRIGLLGKK